MAITIGKLCKDVNQKYKMQLVAGKNGLESIVNWVHIVEDIEVASFLLGYELVFTTGIGNIQNDGYMLNFVKGLVEREVSGLVVNIGPYIKSVPKEVIEYCDVNNFPLYTCPWEMRLVEITRDLCKKIINSEVNEKKLESDLKDYIFYPAQRERIQYVLERRGLMRDVNYCVITMGLDNGDNTVTENDNVRLEFFARREIEKWASGKYVLFWHERYMSIVIAGIEDSKIKEFVNAMKEHSVERFNIRMGVSSNVDNLSKLDIVYERSREVFTMCMKKKDCVLFYNDLGIYKILMSVKDKNVLKDFSSNILGAIKEYDKNNSTDYCDFLKIFIENDGSIQKTSEELFVHRNTINYKISKIKKITGMDIMELENLLLIKLSIEIDNI
ncbi:MAG: PucR family transcriptional regulator ligand-binding domain-containing protein [Lachnospiraceae bacterium]|nr:PucR family transcriptional regulator ligand-binding domain-containing protein [Lachnospiraceae bacterium]